MFNVTASQAQVRLPNERRRRRELTDTISGLESSRRLLQQAFERANQRKQTFFSQNLKMNREDWRGQTAERFHSNDIESITHFANDYLTRLERAITTISRAIATSNTNLTSITQTIVNLERIIAKGGI